MIPAERGDGRGRHEQQDLRPHHRHADARAARASPPTLKIQLPNRVRVSTHEPTTVNASHQSTVVVRLCGPRPCWPRSSRRAVARGVVDVRDAAGDRDRQVAGVQPAQHEERAQRDDEARQLGLHHRHPVDEADRQCRTAARAGSPARCSVPAGRGGRAGGPSCRSSRRRRGRTRRRSSAARRARRRCRRTRPMFDQLAPDAEVEARARGSARTG